MRPPSRIGPYEVVRELGRGGMGTVLEVRHPELPRRLALKLIAPELATAEGLERFAREARLLARIKHPNVVTIHTFDRTDDGHTYLVTDLVEGANLCKVARSVKRPDPTRAARIVLGLASAVEALHAQGILHRDLKPDNVILLADDTPVLLDFGLARDHDAQRLTQTGTVIGTPAYMAPEQAVGGGSDSRLDARTDVYGLGAILFELLAGRPPFEGGAIQVLAAVLGKEPRWPSQDADGVPAALEAVLRKAMAKAPAERHASARALAEDLARIMSGQAVSRPRGARGPRTAGALAALGLALLGVGLLLRGPREEGASPETLAAPPSATDEEPARAPSWNESAPVASYREHLRWLELHAVHRERSRVEEVARNQRLREKPLRRVALDTGQHVVGVIVRWLSDDLLALAGQPVPGMPPTVHSLDVEGDQGPVARWTLPADVGRPWTVAVSPSPDARGRRHVLIGGRSAVHGALLGPVAPSETTAIVSFPPESRLQADGILTALAVSPDGARALVGGDWGFVMMIDLTGDAPRALPPFGDLGQPVDVAAFSPGGDRVVLGTEGARETRIVVFTLEGELRGEHHVGVPIKSVCFAPDGRLVVGTGMGRPLIQSSPTLDAIELMPLAIDLGDHDAAELLAFGAAPGGLLYGVCGPPRRERGPAFLRAWRIDRAGAPVEEVRSTALGERVTHSMAVSPDGTIVAMGVEIAGQRLGVELWAAGDR